MTDAHSPASASAPLRGAPLQSDAQFELAFQGVSRPDAAPRGEASRSASRSPRRPRGSPRSASALPELVVDGFDLRQGDAVEMLRDLPDESIDLCITDPAYESLEKHRAIGTTTRLKHSKASSNDWYSIFPNARFPELFREVHRVLKKNSHFYLFCDQETMFVAKPLAEQAGFRFWKPLVWDKRMIGMGYHYRSRYELVLFFEKGKRKLHSLSIPDIIEVPRIRGGYPSEKPPEVSRILVEQSSERGALVLDPFAGSGSVGVAALRAGRRFLGGDVCREAVDIARARLGALASTSPDDGQRLGDDDAGDASSEPEGSDD